MKRGWASCKSECPFKLPPPPPPGGAQQRLLESRLRHHLSSSLWIKSINKRCKLIRSGTHTARRCRKRRGHSRQGCASTRISSMAMKPGWPWTETASKMTCKSERKKISWDMSSSLTEDAGRTPAARVERHRALTTHGQQPPPGASLLRPSPLIFMQPPSPPSILILSILSSSDLCSLPHSFDTLHLHLFDSPLFFFLSFFFPSARSSASFVWHRYRCSLSGRRRSAGPPSPCALLTHT